MHYNLNKKLMIEGRDFLLDFCYFLHVFKTDTELFL